MIIISFIVGVLVGYYVIEDVKNFIIFHKAKHQ